MSGPKPAQGHMPFPGHRTQAVIDAQHWANRPTRLAPYAGSERR